METLTLISWGFLFLSRCRIMAITPSFQVGDGGSIPLICSTLEYSSIG